MKNFLAILGIIFLVGLAWYFGFLKFLGIKGARCNYRIDEEKGKGNYEYGRCKREMPSQTQGECPNGFTLGTEKYWIEKETIQPNCVIAPCPPITIIKYYKGIDISAFVKGFQSTEITEKEYKDACSSFKQQMQSSLCEKEYRDAQQKWKESGTSCIMSAIELTCPQDINYRVTVNPCVGKILQDKGWQSISAERFSNLCYKAGCYPKSSIACYEEC